MKDTIKKALDRVNGGNQSELARYIGVSPQAVQKWLAGASEPTGKNLRKTAEFLGLSEVELRYGDSATASGNNKQTSIWPFKTSLEELKKHGLLEEVDTFIEYQMSKVTKIKKSFEKPG